MSDKIHVDELLKQGKPVQFNPQGYSMYPVIVPERDSVVVVPIKPEKLKRGDVALYRRHTADGNGKLVLHRVWKHNRSGVYMIGDNEHIVEGPLKEEQFFGVMEELIRKNRHISTHNFVYVVLTRIWLFIRPLRPVISKVVHMLKGGKKN